MSAKFDQPSVQHLRRLPPARIVGSEDGDRRVDVEQVVGVHVPLDAADLDSQEIEEHVQALGLTWPVAVDDRERAHSITLAHGVKNLPAYFVYDRDGRGFPEWNRAGSYEVIP